MLLIMATFFFSPVHASMAICGTGSFKSFMPMGALSTNSTQYRYLQQNTYDRGDGLLVTNDGYISVAMGPYYGVTGDKFIVTFSNGQQTKVVKVDEKAHFISGCHGMSSRDGSVLEAILSGNPSEAYSAARYHGNVGRAYSEFAGTSSITSIVKVSGSAAPVVSHTPAAIVEEEEEESQIMIIYIPNEDHENLLFVDTEFSGRGRDLVQVALINFKKELSQPNLYYLSTSLNLYKDIKVTESFENYTNIKQGFLGNNGVKPKEFIERLNSFIGAEGLDSCNTLLIGHGVKQDHELLIKEGCNLLFVDTYDTFSKAKSILEIESGLSLEALSVQSGYFPTSNHDAYQDAYALISIFSHLTTAELLK